MVTTNYARNGLSGKSRARSALVLNNPAHYDRVRREMRELRVSPFGMLSMEGRYLPNVIHAEEHLHGVVFGYQEVGFSMLVVTDARVIFLDRKPMFMNEDEISFNIIGGVTLTNALFWTNVTLHTRYKDYKMLTLNRPAAELFDEYIDYRCLEHEKRGGNEYDRTG